MAFLNSTDWQGVKLNRVLAAGLVECQINEVKETEYPARERRDNDPPEKVYYPQEVLEVSLSLQGTVTQNGVVPEAKTSEGEVVHPGFPLFPRFRKNLPTETMRANGLTSAKDFPDNVQTMNRMSEEGAKKFLLAALGLPRSFNGDLAAKLAEAGGLAGLKDRRIKVKVSVDSYKGNTNQQFDDFSSSNGAAAAPATNAPF